MEDEKQSFMEGNQISRVGASGKTDLAGFLQNFDNVETDLEVQNSRANSEVSLEGPD